MSPVVPGCVRSLSLSAHSFISCKQRIKILALPASGARVYQILPRPSSRGSLLSVCNCTWQSSIHIREVELIEWYKTRDLLLKSNRNNYGWWLNNPCKSAAFVYGTGPSQLGRQLEKKGGGQVGEHEDKLEALTIIWNPHGWTDIHIGLSKNSN